MLGRGPAESEELGPSHMWGFVLLNPPPVFHRESGTYISEQSRRPDIQNRFRGPTIERMHVIHAWVCNPLKTAKGSQCENSRSP